MSKYDEKAIIRGIKHKEKNNIIAKNLENFISFNYSVDGTEKEGRPCQVVFLDSFKFLGTSLENLVKNLVDKGEDNFVNLRNYFPTQYKDFLRKGVFPYDFCDSLDKVKSCTTFPDIHDFYSQLHKEPIDKEDYYYAKSIYEKYNCTSLYDYMRLYLLTDVLLLADVFESFRNLYYKEYSLDPVYYLTLPSLSQDSALRYSGVELELLTEENQYDFIKSGIRGGISQIVKRHAKANNKFLPDYDPDVPSSFITDLDAVSLYATAMCQPLPYKDFRWMEVETTLEETFKTLKNLEDDFIVSIDVSVPEEIRSHFSDYPLCPENKDGKLICDFVDKKYYVCHKVYYEEILKRGYKVGAIHKILAFKSIPWLKGYIENNTKLRKLAKDDFSKALWELNSNAVYGKQIEEILKRINVSMTSNEGKFTRLVAKPTFKDSMTISENLITCDNADEDHYGNHQGTGASPQYLLEHRKIKQKMNKPIYGGQFILDYSKVIMIRFLYDYLKPKYAVFDNNGEEIYNRYHLLMTDTDSLIGQVYTEDFFEDIKQDVNEWFDTSNFNTDFRKEENWPVGKNKKVLGCFSSEVGSKQILEFVGLRSKQYSLKTEKNVTKKCKGVTKIALKDITFEDYKEALDLENYNPVYREMNLIRSHQHTNYSETLCKKILDGHDSKRKILPDGIHTVPWC